MAPVRKVAPAAEAGEELPAPPEITPPKGDKQARWNALLAQVRADPICQRQLRPGKQVVLGVGTLDAKIMFVGEAPGAEEDKQGEPFVGQAGRLLDGMLASLSLARGRNVYIANVIKCRPDTPGQSYGNRPPRLDEMGTCLPYLLEQIQLIQPRVIVALGGTAVSGLFGQAEVRITRLRGSWMDFHGTPVMPTFHPSYVLRAEPGPDKGRATKRQVWEDMLKVMERLEMPISEKQRGYFK